MFFYFFSPTTSMMIVLINKNYSDRFCPTIWHQLSIHDSIAPGTSQAGCKLMSYTVNIKFARLSKYIISEICIASKDAFLILISIIEIFLTDNWNVSRRNHVSLLSDTLFLGRSRTLFLIARI